MKNKSKKTKFEKFGNKVSLKKELMLNIKGGDESEKPGKGWLWTLSGECSEQTHNCWVTIFGVDPWAK